MRRFTTISPRYHARAYTALLQLLHQPDHHRRFAVAARRKITDDHNGHRRAPGPLHPKTIKQTDNAAHCAVEPESGKSSSHSGIHRTRCVQSFAELHLMKLSVNAAVFQQISMASSFNNDPILNHDDFISLLDSRQTVRNHQRGAVLLQLIQRRLNRAFRFRIQRRGRFVQISIGLSRSSARAMAIR